MVLDCVLNLLLGAFFKVPNVGGEKPDSSLSSVCFAD